MIRRPSRRLRMAIQLLALAAVLVFAACGSDGDDENDAGAAAAAPVAVASAAIAPTAPSPSGTITIYSGRSEDLIGPLLDQFEEDTGIKVRVRWGGSAELAATILEEGDRTPADVFFAQDAGALGALQDAGRLATLPDEILDHVDPNFRSADGRWIGVSGRARVLVHSTERLTNTEVPASVFDLTQPEWKGRVGWAPTNGSFQAFVTAMRQIHGDAVTEQWLRDMRDNDVQEFRNNSTQVQAVGDGVIDVGLVNHYYLFRFLAEDPNFPAANRFTDTGQAGALINIAGAGLLTTSDNNHAAQRFIDYLLEESAQQYFATETFEYPLIAGVAPAVNVPALNSLNPPGLGLTSLADLEGTLDLLREVGALP